MLRSPVRILHLADRLTDRGGAYAWLLGLLDGLAADHEIRLVVGEADLSLRATCPVDVRPGLEARAAAPVELDDVAGDFAPDVVHVHNVVNPSVLEWAALRAGALLTVQDHRFFCPTRGKWTLSGEVCRRPMTRELCAPCFEDAAYFREVHALTERRLLAARRMPVTVLSRYMREELVAAGVPPRGVHVVPPFVYGLDAGAAPSGPPCVLFVGRLVETKGARDAVEAWRRSGVELPLVLAERVRSAPSSSGGREGARDPGWRCWAGSRATGSRGSTDALWRFSCRRAGRSHSGWSVSRPCTSACRSWPGSPAGSGSGTRGRGSCGGGTSRRWRGRSRRR